MIKPRKAVQSMEAYEPPLDDRKGKLKLDFNENTLGCSPRVVEVLKNITSGELATYPDYGKFTKKLATYLNLSSKEILLTNGADEAIQIIMSTYLDKGQEVIIPIPTFALFQIYASLAEASIISVIYGDNLEFPTRMVMEKITSQTRMVILVNPNNPTATAIPEQDILRIVKKARNSLVIIDEAYYQYYGKSAKELIREYDNVVIIQTFSKVFGLAGVRLGYLLANLEIIKNLKKVISPYSVNTLAIIAASAALDDLNFVNSYIQEVKASRIFLQKELLKLGIKTYPSETNFLVANFGEKCQEIYEKLKEKDILVRNRSSYPLLKNCLRLGLGTKEQTTILFDAIREIVKDKALLFDLDGVLVDVSQSYRLAIQETAEYFTKQRISPREIQKLKEQGNYNNDWAVTEALISSRKVRASRDEIIGKFQEIYLKLRKQENWLLKRELLQQLYQQYRLGIVTGRPKEEAEFVLERFQVKDYFDVVITLDDLPPEKQKPDPAAIQLALQKLGRTTAVYFGDCLDDVQAAKKANIPVIGVLPPGLVSSTLKSSLKNAGAITVITDINQMPEVL